MNEFLAQLQEQISRVWASLNTNQKVMFVLAPTVLVVALIIAAYVASRPDYVPLVSTTEETRLAEIATDLQANNVKHQVRGNTILVPRNERDRIRLDLAGRELLGPAVGPGFELFDRTRLGMTDRIFDTQYVRALQNELARTVRVGARYDDVNVLVSIPKEALFKEDQALPSASVKVITTRSVSQQEVIGIQNLVAGAVPKLTPDRVKVFDRSNRPLAGVAEEEETGAALAHKQEEVRRKKELALYDKLAQAIEKLVGPDHYVLTVGLELDWTEKSKTERTLDPESQAPISEKTYSERSTSPVTAGEPGVGSNVQDTGIGAGGVGTPQTEIEETITNYIYPEAKTQIKESVGKTVATHIMVALDHREDPKTKEWAPYPKEFVDSLRQSIVAATGIVTNASDAKDTLSIESIPFDRREAEALRKRYWLDQSQRLVTSILPVIALAIIGVLAYLFYQKAFAPRPIEEVEREEVPIEPVTEIPKIPIGVPPIDISLTPEEQRRVQMQAHVTSYAQEHPDEVAAIIKGWLTA
jgi:flagellar M-ring protein FliF